MLLSFPGVIEVGPSHTVERKQEHNLEKHDRKKNGDFPSTEEKSFSLVVLITKAGMTQGRREDSGSWE